LVSSFNYVIISGSNQESQILEDENFTKSSYSTMMEEFEYCGLFKQLNEEFFFFMMFRIQKFYLNTLICLFFTKPISSNKTFTLKFMIQRILWLYNRDISFDLIKCFTYHINM